MPRASKETHQAAARGRAPRPRENVASPVLSFAGAAQSNLEAVKDYIERCGLTDAGMGTPEVAGPSVVRTVGASSSSTAHQAVLARLHERQKDDKIKLETANVYVSTKEEHLWDVVYTDGACSNNGKGAHLAVGGVGVWFGPNDPRNISERCPGSQTNNRAELIAIIRALESIPYDSRQVLIKTDSKYSVDAVYIWIPNWMKKSKWTTSAGGPVKNESLLRYLAALLHMRSLRKQTVRLQHVRGHVGVPGNELADKLARAGTLLPAVPEDDWDARRKLLEAQAATELAATHSASASAHEPKSVITHLEAAAVSKITEVGDETRVQTNMHTAEDDEWDFDDDELDLLDPPNPSR